MKIQNANCTWTIFSSPDLFNDLHTKAITCYGTVIQNQKRMPRDSGRKLRLNRVI
jgi:hypothetical protein